MSGQMRLSGLFRCSDYEAGICDDPMFFEDWAGFPKTCPHASPHIPQNGCDVRESGCPFFAPLLGPCTCRPIEMSNATGQGREAYPAPACSQEHRT